MKGIKGFVKFVSYLLRRLMARLFTKIKVTDLVIEPAEVNVGEPVTISVMVTNIGSKRGTKTITLEVS